MEVNEEINLRSYIPDRSDPFYYAQHCHEATLAFAFALNKTINGEHNHIAVIIYDDTLSKITIYIKFVFGFLRPKE